MKKLKNKFGFTLVELMIVVSIISILAVPMIYFEIHFSEKFYGNIHRMDMVEAGNRAIEWIGKDIRSAISIPDHWGNYKFSTGNLILNMDNNIIIYAFNPKNRSLTRFEYKKENTNDQPVETKMANNLDLFTVKSTENGRLFHIDLELSKELLNYQEKIKIQGLSYRRMP